jgi:hypothetical protein
MRSEVRHPLAEAYLASLEEAAARLPRSQRNELLAELAEHVDAGVAAADSEADIRNMLDALGDPAEIVAEAAPPGIPDGPSGVLALTLGVLGFVLGLLMALPVSIPLAIIAIVLGVTARRHARRVGGNGRTGTAAIAFGATSILVPLLLWSVLFSARSETNTDSDDTVVRPESAPLPTSTTP